MWNGNCVLSILNFITFKNFFGYIWFPIKASLNCNLIKDFSLWACITNGYLNKWQVSCQYQNGIINIHHVIIMRISMVMWLESIKAAHNVTGNIMGIISSVQHQSHAL